MELGILHYLGGKDTPRFLELLFRPGVQANIYLSNKFIYSEKIIQQKVLIEVKVKVK